MKLNAAERSQQLRIYGLNTANQIRDAAIHLKDPDRKELLALSARITYCNDRANNWIGEDIHNQETGELFEGFGRYWHCSSKLCSFCLRQNSRRNRLKLQHAIRAQKLLVGEHFRFITLTLPNLGLDIPETRSIINYAWSLLRKRLFFVRSVAGGAKAEEFTSTSKGFHYHIHLLTRSKQIRANDLRRAWTECVETAFKEFGHDFVVPTSDNLLFVNIKIVHDLKQVTNEVCKYVTKATSWTKMPMDDLVKIGLVGHWHRMFELFGTFRKINTDKLQQHLDYLTDVKTIGDPRDDNDEQSCTRNHWRILVHQMPLKRYLARLHAEVTDTINRRRELVQLKFPFATIRAPDD